MLSARIARNSLGWRRSAWCAELVCCSQLVCELARAPQVHATHVEDWIL
jgi:hypothetical protein